MQRQRGEKNLYCVYSLLKMSIEIKTTCARHTAKIGHVFVLLRVHWLNTVPYIGMHWADYYCLSFEYYSRYFILTYKPLEDLRMAYSLLGKYLNLLFITLTLVARTRVQTILAWTYARPICKADVKQKFPSFYSLP